MHIVLANQWFPPENGRGGVAMHNYALANAYHTLGHQVTVITSHRAGNAPERETGGVRVRWLGVGDAHRWRRLPLVGRYVRQVQQLAYSWRVDQAIRQLHREQPVDVVEFAEVNAEGFFYARSPQTPFVVRCHTPTFVLERYYDPLERSYDTRIIRLCEKDVIRRACALTTPSRDMARVIADECQIPVQSIAVIPNALCLDEFLQQADHSGDDKITILYVGRLERAKGITVLSDAIPRIIRSVPNVRFVLIGDDRPTARNTSQREELERRLSESSVLPVRFLGGVPRSVLLDWYNRADICVVPSLLYESFSYTCAQAMAAGKPVVASRIGGIPETVDDGVTGLLVTPGDVNELTEALVQLAQDRFLRERMGRAGREKVEREFDAIQVAQQNLDVYRQAIEQFQDKAGDR
jgi:glycosyltransferase involved in cell wall biosynthesis